MTELKETSLILVVDSSQAHLQELISSFKGCGWNAMGTTDAWEAVTLVSQVRMDAIVLDLDLPGIGGVDFCSILRDDPGLESVPVISYWSTRTELAGPLRPAGRDLCFEKPAHLPTLHAAVRKSLAPPFPPDVAAPAGRSPTRFVRRRREPAVV